MNTTTRAAHEKNFFTYFFSIILLLVITIISNGAASQTTDTIRPFQLKKMSLEELMNLEVTSVSKHAEKLNAVASAIQVITQQNILSSGAKTLPEALRLATNLQVAQVNASQWAISARGFNNVLANKLLVLINGRTVYTPLYSGVFWDVQNVLLEDVDRIEVISGPGGTLWGANAVNGVINIITKKSADTKGLFAEAAYGYNLPALGSLRYGGNISRKMSYRIYGTGFKMGNTLLKNESPANDNWTMGQGGFRIDWEPTANNALTLQANIFNSRPQVDGKSSVAATGNNVLARWEKKVSEKFNFHLQAYYDHTRRDFGNGFIEDLKTYDIEWQNRLQANSHNSITYGLGIRLMDHNVNNLLALNFLPAHKTLELYNFFIQDEISLVKDRLRLTIGTKIEHNSYTGFEYQPGSRIAWTPAEKHTVWAAVSRAVKTPGRIDRDFVSYAAPNLAVIQGSSNFISENVWAYELGWRLQPLKNMSLSLATFYNNYDNVRSAEPGLPPSNLPITFGNGVKGISYGFEFFTTSQLTRWCSLRGGYTFFKKDLTVKDDSKDMNKATAESNDPEHQFLIQSTVDLPHHIQIGTIFRYVDKLPKPAVSAYFGLDMRIGWKLNKTLELNFVGQNLFDKTHAEFIPASPSPRDIERSAYIKMICRI